MGEERGQFGRWGAARPTLPVSPAAEPRGRASCAPAAAWRSRRPAPRTRRRRSHAAAGADFFPGRRLSGSRGRRRERRQAVRAGGHGTHQQAEGEGEHHQLPVAHNRPFGTDLIIGPAQLMLGGFIEVLDPIPQAVELVDLRRGWPLRRGKVVARYQVVSGLRVAWDPGWRQSAGTPLVRPIPTHAHPQLELGHVADQRSCRGYRSGRCTPRRRGAAGRRPRPGVKAGGWAGSSTTCQVPCEGRRPMI